MGNAPKRYVLCCVIHMILAACLWYPWGHKKGKRYCEIVKIGFEGAIRTTRENWSIGNYGMLAYEDSIEEARTENLYFGGVNLFNHLGGIHRIYYGNSQLVPSAIWRDYLECVPSNTSPHVWIDVNGCEILRFERIASPCREAIQEHYVRQPILFRWIFDAAWLEKTCRDRELEMWRVVSSDEYPYS